MSKRHRLRQLLDNPHIWRAGDAQSRSRATLATGFTALDEALAGGWPVGTLVELLLDRHGIGELRLLVPAIMNLTDRQSDTAGMPPQWIVLIAPPYIPYAPALADQGVNISRLLVVHCRRQADVLWAMEQALCSGTCAAALAWAEESDNNSLRRLQLAAEKGQSWAILFRPSRFRRSRSPAAVRIHLRADPSAGISAHIFKNRGGLPRTVFMPA